MYQDFRSIFLKILESIEYHGDKDKYIKNFYNAIHLTALNNLIDTLPTDRKEQLNKQLSGCQTKSELADILKQYFKEEEFGQEIQDSSQNLTEDYISEILPTLSIRQRDKLGKLLDALALPDF